MKHLKKIIPATLFSGLLVFAFQNCANENLSFHDSTISSSLEYFNFVYSKNTPVYFDIKVVNQEITDSTYKEFSVVGGITSTEGFTTKPVSWQISILNDVGASVCPLIEGSSATDGSLVMTTCTMLKTQKLGKMNISIWADGQKYDFSKVLTE